MQGKTTRPAPVRSGRVVAYASLLSATECNCCAQLVLNVTLNPLDAVPAA